MQRGSAMFSQQWSVSDLLLGSVGNRDANYLLGSFGTQKDWEAVSDTNQNISVEWEMDAREFSN